MIVAIKCDLLGPRTSHPVIPEGLPSRCFNSSVFVGGGLQQPKQYGSMLCVCICLWSDPAVYGTMQDTFTQQLMGKMLCSLALYCLRQPPQAFCLWGVPTSVCMCVCVSMCAHADVMGGMHPCCLAWVPVAACVVLEITAAPLVCSWILCEWTLGAVVCVPGVIIGGRLLSCMNAYGRRCAPVCVCVCVCVTRRHVLSHILCHRVPAFHFFTPPPLAK